jgi:hypothetical protein
MVLSNGSLYFPPFSPSEYSAAVHEQEYRYQFKGTVA